jgi:hypothetical protein
MRNAYTILIRKPEVKRPLVRLWSRWEANIKIDVKETGMRMWTGFIWFRIRSKFGLLLTQ